MRNTLLALGLALAAAPLSADIYTLDASHTEVGFQVTHLSVAKVRGRFTAYDAKIDINEKDVTKSKISISIDAASVSTGNPKRDGHLQNEDFFDAAKNPKIAFKSTKIAKAADGGYSVTGDLTIRGVTKPVTLKASLSEPFETDWGTVKRAFSLSGAINRFDYQVGWNKKTKTGSLVVAEEVQLVIDGEIDKPAKK